jgi:hypothetical protein
MPSALRRYDVHYIASLPLSHNLATLPSPSLLICHAELSVHTHFAFDPPIGVPKTGSLALVTVSKKLSQVIRPSDAGSWAARRKNSLRGILPGAIAFSGY